MCRWPLGHKCEKQGMFLKTILVKALNFTSEWLINTDERAARGTNACPKKACLLAGSGIVPIFAYYV
jgi:hypothetical protein